MFGPESIYLLKLKKKLKIKKDTNPKQLERTLDAFQANSVNVGGCKRGEAETSEARGRTLSLPTPDYIAKSNFVVSLSPGQEIQFIFLIISHAIAP